ncbi:MAG TPA: aspartyl-phosphate phosphatase Spo0E family protein [Firmicutes bacterium]|nr:aspartyl-phosphate phosphatase Spo0E family protein [Bacillota bacterium]
MGPGLDMLFCEIEVLRARLRHLAGECGGVLSSEEMCKISEELDRLIVKYMGLKASTGGD